MKIISNKSTQDIHYTEIEEMKGNPYQEFQTLTIQKHLLHLDGKKHPTFFKKKKGKKNSKFPFLFSYRFFATSRPSD